MDGIDQSWVDRMLDWLRYTIFVDRSVRLAAWITTVWVFVLLFPYLVVGETWGMIWFYLTLPMSMVFKFTWDSDNPIFYVLIATVAEAMMVFIVLVMANKRLEDAFGRLEDDRPKRAPRT